MEASFKKNLVQPEYLCSLANSRADLAKDCAFCDKSMKLGTWFLDILRSILRNGAISDLAFGDL